MAHNGFGKVIKCYDKINKREIFLKFLKCDIQEDLLDNIKKKSWILFKINLSHSEIL